MRPDRRDADGAGVRAADGDGHPADADRERIAAERAEMKRLDRDTLVETEVAQAAGFAFLERGPIDRRDVRAGADRQIVQGCRHRHCD